MMTLQTKMLYILWDFATRIGMRRLGAIVRISFPQRYQDSIFFVDGIATVYSKEEKNQIDVEDRNQSQIQRQPKEYIGLTIDDGICRPLSSKTTTTTTTTARDDGMIENVCQLLDMYQHSKATFFVCTDYTTVQDASLLLSRGHELGNHLQRDVSNYYCYLSPRDFELELVQANQFLEQILHQQHQKQQQPLLQDRIQWFRAPQGRMSVAMSQILKKHHMTNVMGDVYCDDWAFAESVDGSNNDDDYNNINEEDDSDDDTTPQQQRQQQAATTIANLMIRQAQPGSIAIFHMPQHNFRKASILALQQFLQHCQEQNWKCVTVTELVKHQHCPSYTKESVEG
jgi:peptidoglycan/xylan/chitin deacetylase (PgdA/CDA1 family)